MSALLSCWILHSQTHFWLGGQFVNGDLLVSGASCSSWTIPQRRGGGKGRKENERKKKSIVSQSRQFEGKAAPPVDGCLVAAWTTYDHLQRQLSYKYTIVCPLFN